MPLPRSLGDLARLQKLVASRTAINFAATVVILAAGLANSVLIARWLGPEGRGQVAAALLWPLLLPYLGATGLIDALVYFAARPHAEIRKVFGNSVVMGLGAAAILIVLGFFALPWLLANQARETIDASRLLLVSIPLVLIGEFAASLLRSQLLLTAYNVQRLFVPVGYLIGTVGLHLAGSLTTLNIVLLQLLLSIGRMLVAGWLCRTANIDLGIQVDWRLGKQMLAYSGKTHMGAIAENANARLDQALIAAWLPPAQLGLYVTAVSATSLIKAFSQALKITMLPQLAGEHQPNQQDRMLTLIFQRYWIASLAVAPLFSLSLVWLIPAIFGSEFADATPSAIILVFGAIVVGAKDLLSTGAKAIGQPWIGSKAEIWALVLLGVLLLALLPSVGIIGAAITSVLAYSIALLVVTKGLVKERGIEARGLYLPLGSYKLVSRLMTKARNAKYT